MLPRILTVAALGKIKHANEKQGTLQTMKNWEIEALLIIITSTMLKILISLEGELPVEG